MDNLLKNDQFRGISFMIHKQGNSPAFTYRAYVIDRGERGMGLHIDHLVSGTQGPVIQWHKAVHPLPNPEMKKEFRNQNEEQTYGCCLFKNIRWKGDNQLSYERPIGRKTYLCYIDLQKLSVPSCQSN